METTSRNSLSELRAVLGVLRAPTRGPAIHQHRIRDRIPQHGQSPFPPPWKALDIVDACLVLVVVPLAVETSAQPSGGAFWLNILACALQGVLLMTVRRSPIPGALALIAVTGAQTAFLTPLPQSVGW